ncbi:MAG TPA: signal recognition particle-docking protein FtsY [Polyangiales bacterium]|nr:signal recognition particle-docking protein FtsY [Polyangiales bacterium]
MDSSVVIAVVAVLLVGLVWFLLRRRAPSLPEQTTGQGEPPATQLPPQQASAPEALPAPPTPSAAPPSAPPAAEQVEAPARTSSLPAGASQHERDVAALRKGLANTRGGFIARLAKLFGARKEIDPNLIEEIEEVLITSDIGVKTSERMLAKLREQMANGALTDADSVWKCLRELAVDVLSVPAKPIELSNKPSLVLVVGVNGAGKTTTIGKLAARYSAVGRKVLLAAGDTFRAAAVLQLEVWGKRVNCPVVTGKEGADPGAVIFDAVKRAQAEGFDLVIADTAGRLHTKVPLMEELKKVDRTVQKALGGRAVDEILLVLDATTGQNAVQQMHMFREALQVSGVVLTKLDGTAKGGMILGIVDEHRIPVRFIGLGERIEDLREFDAASFVEALFAKPDGETLAA